MYLLVFATAFADDSAFTCDPLTTPADGLVYADVGARSDAVFDTLVALVRAEFEDGCPSWCDDGGSDCLADDCVTSTGTRITVDYRSEELGDFWDGGDTETWEVTVEPAGAAWTRLTLSSAVEGSWSRGGGHGYDYSGEHAWTATWEGEVDPAYPADRTVTVTRTESVRNDDFYDYAWSRYAEAWDDGVCAWDATEAHDYWDGWDAAASWSFVVGDQTLTLSQSVVDCDASVIRDATLDGVTTRIVDPDWAPVVDVDGDGVDAAADCDDTDAARNACAEDIPGDGIDQDCDGADTVDADGDGWIADQDCDDTDPTVYPWATEVVCDGIDQDCSSGDERDEDNDGHEPAACGGDDCDDADRDVNPDERDDRTDGVDQDCDGVDGIDRDGDGFPATRVGGDDCDDFSADVHPGATEIPYDGVDQDCADGDLLDADGDGHDALAEGGTDCDDTTPAVSPDAVEVPCDGTDQDCDGVDPSCADDPDTGDTATEAPEEEPPSAEAPERGCATGGPRGGGAALLVASLALVARRRARR